MMSSIKGIEKVSAWKLRLLAVSQVVSMVLGSGSS